MGKATVDVSLIMLTELLKTTENDGYQFKVTDGLPKDARLVDIEIKNLFYQDEVNKSGQVRLTFESQFIEDMQEGADIPVITPMFHKIIRPYSWEP